MLSASHVVATALLQELRLGLGLGFLFNVYFVSTKPTALSSCVTVMSQVAYK